MTLASREDAAASGAAEDPQGGGRDLRDYWRALVQRRLVILSCLGVTVASTATLTLFSTPEYQSTTTLQIDRQAPDILTYKDVVGADPSYAAYQDFYQTQYKILQSRSVIRLAIERVDLLNRPEFATRERNLFARIYRGCKQALSGDRVEQDPLEPAFAFVEENLSVHPIRNSQLVEVSFTDRDPALARDLAQAMSDAYLQFNFHSRYDTTGMAKEFLTKEVARLQTEMSQLERQLQEYSTQNEILSLSDGTQDISEQALGDLNRRYIEARGRLVVAETRHQSVQDSAPDALPEVLNSPLIANLKQQYAEVERRHSQMAERFKPDWPPLMQLQEELTQARARLVLETDAMAGQVGAVASADYNKAKAEVLNLEHQVADQKDEVQRVNRDAIQFAGLKAAIETKRRVLSDLVARQSETETTDRLKDTRTSNIRVVDAAETPIEPVRPNKKLNLLLSLLLGSCLGVGMATLLDYLDNTIKTEQDIVRVAHLPVLGYVPKFQPLRVVSEGASGEMDPRRIDMTSFHDARSAFAEAYKNLRTSLLLASPDHPPRHILVTSCQPQEGKSTVSMNLAIVLTQLGRRVLLVDADLRRPRLHKTLGLQNGVGLSNFLSGNAAPGDILQETEVPGLFAVTSGPIPPNPSELLGSPSLGTLLEGLRREHSFDHVIFDSPPLLSVSDPVILAARMDGTIVVVRACETTRDSLAHVATRLRQSRARVVGAVLNVLTEDGQKYYSSRYGYYRAHGEEDAMPRGGVGTERPTRRKLPSLHRS